MCGSSESHTAYVYESLFNVRSTGGHKQVAAVEEQEAPVGPRVPGATPECIASRTRGNQRSPVKQKRRQQLQLDQMLPKRQKRSSPSKAGKETPGAGTAKPQVLFPSEPSPITQRGLDITKMPSSDPDSPYPAWLQGTGRLETPGRPKRPQARRVLYT